MGQARVESGLNANARAGTSSASGLYQFIEFSWLAVVKKHGTEHGLGWAADAIGKTAGGRYTVDGGLRAQILALRNNPEVASLMAAEHAGDNKDALEGTLGRSATGTDLYMAHFLGLGGAKQFLRVMQATPDKSAASLFPGAARANRGVFFNADGSARSLSEVYARSPTSWATAASRRAPPPPTNSPSPRRRSPWGRRHDGGDRQRRGGGERCQPAAPRAVAQGWGGQQPAAPDPEHRAPRRATTLAGMGARP
ncbi:hypothetical protein AB5I41_22315 [Sphingomonas sp. MMS24-JH45]